MSLSVKTVPTGGQASETEEPFIEDSLPGNKILNLEVQD